MLISYTIIQILNGMIMSTKTIKKIDEEIIIVLDDLEKESNIIFKYKLYLKGILKQDNIDDIFNHILLLIVNIQKLNIDISIQIKHLLNIAEILFIETHMAELPCEGSINLVENKVLKESLYMVKKMAFYNSSIDMDTNIIIQDTIYYKVDKRDFLSEVVGMKGNVLTVYFNIIIKKQINNELLLSKRNNLYKTIIDETLKMMSLENLHKISPNLFNLIKNPEYSIKDEND